MSDQGNAQNPGAWGQPEQPQQPYGQPQYGDPTRPYEPTPPYEATPPNEPPAYQPPPPYGQPTQPYGQPPAYGQPPGYGQPYGDPGQPQYGQPGYGAPPPGFGPGGPGGPTGPGGPGQPAGGGGRRGLWAGIGLVALLVLGIGAFLLLSGGDSSSASPKDPVKTFMEAGKTLDFDKAKSVLCKADLNDPDLVKQEDADRVVSYTIGTVTKKDSDHATVRVSVVTKGESKAQSADLPVKKEGGKWKVCVSDMFANLPTSLPTGFSSGIPSEFPTNLIPTGLPTEVTDLPSGLPSGLPTSGICASAEDALTPAETYMGLASFGFTSVAQACVYQDSVPQSVTARLSGGTLYTPGQDKTGDDNHGPKGEYDFTSIDGSKKVTVTVTKQSDGKYYVTGVDIH